MCGASVNTVKWINAHSNEPDSIRFQSGSILVCSVNKTHINDDETEFLSGTV